MGEVLGEGKLDAGVGERGPDAMTDKTVTSHRPVMTVKCWRRQHPGQPTPPALAGYGRAPTDTEALQNTRGPLQEVI